MLTVSGRNNGSPTQNKEATIKPAIETNGQLGQVTDSHCTNSEAEHLTSSSNHFMGYVKEV